MTLVDELKDRFGVEPVLRVLGVAVSTYYGRRAQATNPSPRRRLDAELAVEIAQIHEVSGGTYGSSRVHAMLRRQGRRVGRKRVERLMPADHDTSTRLEASAHRLQKRKLAPSSGKIHVMTEISLSVPAYDAAIGVVAAAEGGTVTVEVVNGAVEIFGDPAGLRDLARMCLALSDSRAPHGAHIHLDAGINPLDLGSASVMLARYTPPEM